MEKISAVYKIVNTITGESYVGSSKNVKKRWKQHKCQSYWKRYPNSMLYQDFQKYGVDKFHFQILCSVMEEYLKDVEQELIEMLQPVYNSINAKGLDVERHKEYNKEYQQSDKAKEYQKKHRQSEKYKERINRYHQSEKWKEIRKNYAQSDKGKEARKRFRHSEKGREANRACTKKRNSRLCLYNGETLSFGALVHRFSRAGVEHPVLEANKYLIH